ncbi:hypothetical protein LOK55_04185 [Microbacterium sp. F2E]|uniref:hypothetical protein n=1 Tax=Microbacterium sp. F2E TaxID=2895284 RepID=UPI001E3F1852|nr:hypothetical protein [Microbacterium sp. F2E]MCC9053509.1 hypothetical protein [Microbacterium sp. F2E]
MPTFDDPTTDATEASEALRGLAHASRTFTDPADTYRVLGDVLYGVRSLRQVLDQLATTHLTYRVRAHDDAGDQAAGATSALAAADELHQAATILDGVHDRVDAAMSHSGRIAWYDAPEQAAPERAPSRWISVVFLEGEEADRVLDVIARRGTDAAIEHLAGHDYGEDTTRDALENGYVYDTVPEGALDRTATRDVYTLTYSPFLGHVNLLREYDAVPDPALLGIDTSEPVTRHAERAPVTRASRREAAQTEPDWFAGSRRTTPGAGRGLSR